MTYQVQTKIFFIVLLWWDSSLLGYFEGSFESGVFVYALPVFYWVCLLEYSSVLVCRGKRAI